MNSLPRWLISITDTPEPCQSSISSAAWRSTASGNAAGPGLKLKTRVIGFSSGARGRPHDQRAQEYQPVLAHRTGSMFDLPPRPEYFSAEHEAFRAAVRRFVAAEIAPHVADWDEAGTFPRALYGRAAEVGLIGVGYPEALGG